jgi:Ca2+-binding RTX toxin-like protein
VFSACLLAPDAVEASTLSRDGDTVVYTDTGADIPNNVHVGRADGTEGYLIAETYFMDQDGTPGITDEGSGCEDQGGDLFLCTDVSAFRIELGGGSDEIHGDTFDFQVDIPILADLGPGNDFVFAGTDDDDLRGGPGSDSLAGSAGSDVLDGGFDSDYMDGGADGDLVTYASRTEPIAVDFTVPGPVAQPNGSSNDGSPGARDHIRNVETVVGGSGDDNMKAASDPVTFRGGDGNDTLTGSPGTETLVGGDGADTIDALGGADTVLAGAGNDSVESRDGTVDIVDCGPDSDSANVDSIDEVTSCGQDPPPGGTTVIDRPVFTPSRVLFDLAYTFAAGRRGTTLRNLAAEVEQGARVTATCRTKKRKRCTRTRDFARTARSVRLKSFEGKRLPVGAKLTIQVTKDGSIGAVKTLTIRKRKAPSVKTLCIPVGATGPSAC